MNSPTPTTHPTDTFIQTRDLGRSFGSRDVLRGLTLDLPRAGTIGLVGRNGVGKTTLMGILAGQLRASTGSITVDGRDPFDDAAVMDRVCFTGVDVLYPPRWSVDTVLTVAAARYPYWDADLAESLAGRFGLARFGQMASLSTGHRSLVSVVVGLASRAPLTLLDEPYSGLDVQRRRLFYEILAEEQAAAPRCILLSTHHLADAGRSVDRLLILAGDGSLAHDLDAAEFDERVVRLTGSTALMHDVLDELRGGRDGTAGDLPQVVAMRDVAGTMSLDVDLRGATVPQRPGVTVQHLDAEDTVIALTGLAGEVQ